MISPRSRKRSTLATRRETAIERGLSFIYQTSCEPDNFATYGFDYLGCFQCIAATSKDPKVRRSARKMGRERAAQWRRDNSELSDDLDSDQIIGLVYGGYAADRLGARDDRMKSRLKIAATKYSARDYFAFDPRTEPPPRDVPEECVCETLSERGRKTCRQCRKRLTMATPYAVWQDALVGTFMGDCYGVKLGASYADVVKWLPTMRPYPRFTKKSEWEFYDATYAITHLVYTLNSYSRYRVLPRWLPAEFSFLKQNLTQAITMDDPETMGEFLDCLKSFGLAESHPLILQGVNFLLATQNSDGSWGEVESDDIYQRYHPTWTAIDGLREYKWYGTRLSFPRVAPVLKAKRFSLSETRTPKTANQRTPARRQGASV